MIVISRGLARSVRALARKCVTGRPRGPAPPVAFESRAGTLTAWVTTDDAILVYAAPTRCDDEVLVVPMGVLEAVEGAGDAPAELAVGPGRAGEARFVDRGVPATHPFDALLPGKPPRPPARPDDGHPVPGDFLAALHACGRTAAREPGRLALTRVQVQGAVGRVIATDGRTALIRAGFRFPFAEDLLVPAVPVFGARELATESAAWVARTPTHLVVAAGPWRVHLRIDPAGRFPDVPGVVPADAPTVARLDPRDAAGLAEHLSGLPGAAAEDRPVTLALDGGVVIRARDDRPGRAEHVRLDRSRSTGPRVRVAVDRRVLARALALGCVTVRVTPGKPVVFAGPDTTLITVALDPARTGRGPGGGSAPARATTDTERRTTVRHETSGPAPPDRPEPPAADPPDPLAEAEALRAALAEAAARAGRLVAALKGRKKETQALSRVWAGLRRLNLGPGGTP